MLTRVGQRAAQGVTCGCRPRVSCGVTTTLAKRDLGNAAVKLNSSARRRSFHASSSTRKTEAIAFQSFDEVTPMKAQPNDINIATPQGKTLSLSARWLRDHCHCKSCVHQDTLQRNFDSFSNNDRMARDVKSTQEGVEITWAESNHVSTYPWTWLHQNTKQDRPPVKRTLWDASIAKNPPTVDYSEVMDSTSGVAKWTANIWDYGFSFVDGCPATPDATEKLLERIALIRITHYGGFYDFTADLSHKDTAYTNLALPAHTDNTYFTDPAGLQMFHLLSHTADNPAVERSDLGGKSLLVDGFHCASILKAEDPSAYDILAKTPVPAHASGNEGIVITPSQCFPVFNHNPQTGELVQLRWNNDDRATMPPYSVAFDGTTVSYDEWFEAARKWNDVIKRGENEYWEQLRPGRPLIFDNWRVMHARSAFTGKRRMAGAYINRDDFVSRYWNTNFGREEVLKRII